MRLILLEDLSVLIYEKDGAWIIEEVEFETVEMDCLCVDGKYYQRVQDLDISTIEIEPIPDRPFDDFDQQISCEEYYGG